MEKKKNGSIRLKIMIPVLILGIVAVASNFLALSSTRKVNKNASEIADHYMKSLTKLSSLKEQIQELHNLGLSHIIATDSESMIFYILNVFTEKERYTISFMMQKELCENIYDFMHERLPKKDTED